MIGKPGSIFSVGIDYDDTPHPQLPDAPNDARLLEQFFVKWGFTAVDDCRLLSKESPRVIADSLERWADDVRKTRVSTGVVLYIAGHGRLHNGQHYILAASSPERPPYFGSKALSVEDAVGVMLNSGAGVGLMLVDSCYSGFAAAEIQQSLDRAAASQNVPGMDLGVLVPSLHHQKSYSGLFVNCILESLAEGSRRGHWKDGDEFVTLFELRQELRDRLEDDQSAYVAGRDGIKIFPNPRYRASAADRAVELGALLNHLSAEDREHFLLKAASTDAGDLGWYFSGREAMSRETLGWLATKSNGVLVVTGAPGSGKSAFLGRLAVLADQGSQAACRALGLLDGDPGTVPPIGIFDAVVHVKNRRSYDVAREIGEQLGIDLSDSSSPPRDLVTALSDARRSVTILADALDEAEQGDEIFIARDVLRAIGSLPDCRVLVGTRKDREGSLNSASDDEGPLIGSLRPKSGNFRVLDLSDDPAAAEDIQRYVEERLSGDTELTVWPTPGKRQLVAHEISTQADKIFLYARFALRALESLTEDFLSQDNWRLELGKLIGDAGLDAIFAHDLLRFDDPVLISDILTPLAFARGKGLPRREIWPDLANALSFDRSARAYNAADISRVIREAGWYLIEATEDGQSVFRLYHQSISDYFRKGAVSVGRVRH